MGSPALRAGRWVQTDLDVQGLWNNTALFYREPDAEKQTSARRRAITRPRPTSAVGGLGAPGRYQRGAVLPRGRDALIDSLKMLIDRLVMCAQRVLSSPRSGRTLRFALCSPCTAAFSIEEKPANRITSRLLRDVKIAGPGSVPMVACLKARSIYPQCVLSNRLSQGLRVWQFLTEKEENIQKCHEKNRSRHEKLLIAYF